MMPSLHSFVKIENNLVKSTRTPTIHQNSVGEQVIEALEKAGDQEVVVNCHTRKSWTGKSTLNCMLNVCHNLKKFGVRKGDVVCFFVNNVDHHAIAALSVIAVGGVYTGVDHNYPVDEVVFHLLSSSAQYLVVNDDTYDVGLQAVEEINEMSLSRRIRLVTLGGEGNNNSYISTCTKLGDLLKSNEGIVLEKPKVKIDNEKDLVVIGYSSGSTGRPKAIKKNHRSFIMHLNLAAEGFEFSGSPKDVNLIKARFGHLNPLQLFYISLVRGAKSILYDPYDGDFDTLFLSYVDEFKVTSSFLLPSTINHVSKVVTERELRKYNLTSLNDVTVGGSQLSTDVALDFVARTKIRHFRQCYGSTDAGWVSFNPRCLPATDVEPIGIPLPGVTVKIANPETGEPLPANQIGEICVAGPFTLVNCYMSEKANEENFDSEGFIKMGDLGYYNNHGQIFITGRLKRIMKCDGLQVSPTELESILMANQLVVEAVVLSVPSDLHGDVPKAFVKVNEKTSELLKMAKAESNTRLEEEMRRIQKNLINYVDEKVAPFKRLRGGVELLYDRDFPRTVIGKIDAKKLK